MEPGPTAGDTPSAAKPSPIGGLRQRILPVAGGIAGLAVLGFGANWLINGQYEIKTDNAYVRADIAEVASKIQGYVAAVHVVDNQRVKAGDLLVTLEKADYEARLAEAKAAAAQAKAEAEQARARLAAQKAAVLSARGRANAQRDAVTEAHAQVEAADASAKLAKSDAQRYAELAKQGWYPKAKVEAATAAERANAAKLAQAQAAVTTQNSQLSAQQAAVGQAKQELTASDAAVASADARAQAAAARVAAAELDLSRTEMRAPVDGVIGNKNVTVGQLMSPGAIALAVVPTNDAYVIASYKETQVARMRPGQQVNLKIDAYPGLEVHGRVESVAQATGATFSLIPQDTATGNFTKIVQRVPVRIALDKDALATGLMRPGLSVVATVVARTPTAK